MVDTSHQNQGIQEPISVREILLHIRNGYTYIRSRWLVILLITVLGGALGLIYFYFSPPAYKASTTFVLENGEGSGGLSQYAGLASMAGIDLGGGGGGIFQGDNIVELYKSRTMIQNTLLTNYTYQGKSQLLVERFIQFNKLRDKWKDPDLKDIRFDNYRDGVSRLKDSVLGTIVNDINKKYLSVGKPDKKLSIIRVDVTAKDEIFTKGFNDQIVKNVNDFYVRTKTKKSLENLSILQQKTDSVRAVMNGAVYTAAAIGDATPNLNPTRQVQRLAPIQKAQYSAEANKAMLTELVKNLEMSRMALRKEMPLIQIIDHPILPLEKQKMGKLKSVILFALLFAIATVVFLLLKKIINGLMA